MDLSSVQQHHHQELDSQTLESMLVCTAKPQQEKKPRPPAAEQGQKCPRCDSTNTKFCYYNNYSLTQPRYFCKSCRRYWTKGGTLRNVPVGGGCRKNKRSSSSSTTSSSPSTSSSAAANRIPHPDQSLPSVLMTNQSHPISNLSSLGGCYDCSDLSLAFASLQKGQLGFEETPDISILGPAHQNPNGNNNDNNANTCGPNHHGFLDVLRAGFLEAPNGFQNLYYNVGNVEESSNNGMSMVAAPPSQYDEMGDGIGSTTTAATTVTTVKQELGGNGNAREGGDRVLWGFPWQFGGDANMGGGVEIDSQGRQSWNGFGGSSSWHGLLNSPLMSNP